MKALKIIIGIIVIIALCVGAYMVFFYHPGNAQEIMDNHKKEKADFEEKVKGLEGQLEEKQKVIDEIDLEIEIIAGNFDASEADRFEWIAKYKGMQSRLRKKKAELKTLADCIAEWEKISLQLGECETGIEKTEISLRVCSKLSLKLEEQKTNWIEKYLIIKSKSKDQEVELIRRDATIQALKKVSTKINLKKAAIYTGIIFVAIKLFQIIFSK